MPPAANSMRELLAKLVFDEVLEGDFDAGQALELTDLGLDVIRIAHVGQVAHEW